MDKGQWSVHLDEGVYKTWRSIGVLEDLTADGDVARLLVALYLGQKQREGEESRVRCADCHCPLTLYCSTCHCPSPLPLPSQPPPPSLSSPPPPPPPTHALDASAPVLVTDHIPQRWQRTFSSSSKDEDIQNESEDNNSEDCSFNLDIVKTKAMVSGCELVSDCSKPVVRFRLTPSSIAKSRKRKTNRGRKRNAVSGYKRNSTSSASQNKAAERRTDKNETSSSSLAAYTKIEDKKYAKEVISLDSVKVDNYKHNVNENCCDTSLEKCGKVRKKRKPCASCDLEEGHILSAEERYKAQVHIYDDNYLQSHRVHDDHRRPGRHQRTTENQTEAHTAAEKGGRRHTTSCPANSDSDQSAEEAADSYGCNAQTGHCSPLNCQQKNNTNHRTSQANDSKLLQAKFEEDTAKITHASKTESSKRPADAAESESPVLSILVSAQKIQPVRTTDGNYARFLYSYFECAHCRKAFTHKRAFNSHVQTHTTQNMNNCPTGRTGLDCPLDSVKHRSRATVQCEMCGVHLKSMYALRFHIAAIHKNDRPFKCGLCDKSFVLKTKLRSHMKYKHAEGGRQFHCDQCSYRAFDARGLKVHQMCVHFKERPFKCSFCPSAFAIKFYLDVHLRKHTGEKPFRCTECSQTFAQRPSLTRHRRNYHGLEPISGREKGDPC